MCTDAHTIDNQMSHTCPNFLPNFLPKPLGALHAESFFSAGFGVSAWLVTHGFGADWHIQATIHHQKAAL